MQINAKNWHFMGVVGDVLVSLTRSRTRLFHPSKILKPVKFVSNTRSWTRALQCSENSINNTIAR
ncbi:hypothetical protein LR48_Vigan694s000200 [Vigna angularis]|uniref:Uncharacterized protein n=1 Tax=Phaseolus angularis TaxID=3914 RepID=A0A0L9TFU0_PHAAN|nr:hypothetical protein LR48_Vigan694s000200 [Vigna angularis]